MSDRRIIIALDFPSPNQALEFANRVSPEQCALKVGFELFVAGGPQLIEKLRAKNFAIFLDLKFHDIPNTVASACAAATQLEVWMLNVHASGGSAMLTAARTAIDQQTVLSKPILLAVTVLTSLNQAALSEVGITIPIPDLVSNWARLAMQSGVDGVVSSAQEAQLIRANTNEQFVIVTPGIRLANNSVDDQKRIMTPSEAREVGVNHIVVGRPITQAEDPTVVLAEFNTAFCGA